MEKVGHTPGPWHHGVGNPELVWAGRSVSSRLIANCRDQGSQTAESVANARLIAASPRLLASCRELVRLATAQATPDDDWTIAIEEAEAAIAEATALS